MRRMGAYGKELDLEKEVGMASVQGELFDHERPEVYRKSIAFIAWLSALLEQTVRAGK